jgi:hypothetical protein
MAESQQKQQNTSQTNDKRSEGKGRGRQNRRVSHGNELKKQDPDAAPILKFGPGNNLQFKEALLTKALEEYGALGKLIKKETFD